MSLAVSRVFSGCGRRFRFSALAFGAGLNLFLLAACHPAHSGKTQPAAVNGVLDLRQWDFEKDGPVIINGEWKFYWNRFESDIGPGDSPGKILPGAWNSFVFEGKPIGGIGYATYRLRILLPPESNPLALKTGGYDSAAKLTAADLTHFIGKPGRTREDTLPVYRQDVLDLAPRGGEMDLIVETSNFFHQNGGMLAAPVLDNASSLHGSRLREQMWQGMLGAAFLIFGVYHLLLHAIRRNGPAFYFGLYCVLFFVRMLQTGEENIHILFPDLDFRIDLFLEYLGLFLFPPIFGLFLHALFPAEVPRYVKNFLILAGGIYTCTLLFPPETYSRLLIGFQVVIVLAVLTGIYAAVRGTLRRRPGAMAFLAGFGFLGAGTVIDVAINLRFSVSTSYASLGMIGYVLAQAVVIAKRFSDALSESERLSRVLQLAYADAVDLREKLGEKQKMAAIGDMAAGIVHDLKNPVGIIKGSVEMADDDSLNRDERRSMLQIINQEADRMLAMTQDILDFSQGEVTVRKQTVDVQAYIKRAVSVLEPNFREKQISFSTDVQASGQVSIDPERFLRVLVNIAGNAADALPDGGNFSLRVGRQDGCVVFTLRDNGPGIPESIRDGLFQPFVTHGKAHGTGLGMAIAKSMVEAHGGTISFETETGKGTAFTIEVPA